MKNDKGGQALVEFALILPIFIILISLIVGVTKWMILKQRVLMIARHASRLQAQDILTHENVSLEIQRTLESLGLEEEGRCDVSFGRFLETPASRFYRLVGTNVSCVLNLGFNEIVVRDRVVTQKRTDR